MKQLIEDLISALEYHVEQTRPIHSTTVALQAAREALKSLPPQRTWVGLTGEEKIIMSRYDLEYAALIGEVERKLKELNT